MYGSFYMFQAEMSASLLFHQQDDKQVFFEFPTVVFQLEFYLKQLLDVYHQLEGTRKGLFVVLFFAKHNFLTR